MGIAPLNNDDTAISTFDMFKSSYGIKSAPGFFLGQSTITDKTKCIGGFVDFDLLNLTDAGDNMVELLRVPETGTFSIHTVLDILNQHENQQKFKDTNNQVKHMFGLCCENPVVLEHLSETLILIVYFIIFERLETTGYALPGIISAYLNNVLLNTDVRSLYSDLSSYCSGLDLELMAQYGLSDMHRIFQSLVEFCRCNFEAEINPQLVAKIMASVVSRCLEIPHEDDQGCDDFYVRTTLVPVLDYINHDNRLINAHFDVDRKTNDVLLLLDLDRVSQKTGILEVFISYSPVVEVVHFEKVYGFSPASFPQNVIYVNLCLDKHFLSLNGELDLFYKWFEIKPCIQFMWKDRQVYINDCIDSFQMLLIPFLNGPSRENSCPAFTYSRSVHQRIANHFSEARGSDSDDYSDACKDLIVQQESSSSEAIGLPQLAWTYHHNIEGEEKAERLDKEQILEMYNGKLTQAIESFQSYLCRYLKWRLEKLDSHIGQLSSFGQALAGHEQSLINHFLQQITHNKPVYWSDTNTLNNQGQGQECAIPSLLEESAHVYLPHSISDKPEL
ncbi:LANO_0H22606g1_1 [Lachancea nothofagi CBS 11611]|uniref:LANO_0H22606g1_1 n=1 Tax=Lachancea nothofagi CBS 11611 TaxID=1266666 RepID=A0A1G4KNN4_9SACH|nr:LANO_0H22606g1_1 [Lachancea nothofagi CBS 11611]